MVKKVQAFEADDGTIFSTEAEAAKHDAYKQLEKLGIFNHASIAAVLGNAKDVMTALQPYADLLPHGINA